MAALPQASLASQSEEIEWGITEARIRDTVLELVEDYKPLRVIAFGSWARGEAGPDSDLDLAVILDDRSVAEPERHDARPSIRMSVDRIVANKEVHQRWAFAINNVHHDIAFQGIILYDREAGLAAEPFYPKPTAEELVSIKMDSVEQFMKRALSDEKALLVEGLDAEIRAFHGQQALEKLMKAWLTLADVKAERTHNLVDLALDLQENGLKVPALPVDLKAVTQYAVEWRYEPPSDADELDLGPLRKAVETLREHVAAQIAASTR